ncbi:TonB-dependent receptor SusC [termite gut metagenome]|uniref:TonB-dependent receptor SusC n=1 Tax=termite gut metagenome TaxID=433724 RepID=A0A5J4QTX6_9ZZZZ
MKYAVFILLASLFPVSLYAQQDVLVSPDSIVSSFTKQLSAYPMEKIHVQTDKSYYLGGEDVWFRAFLVDALSHRPDTSSRYVYAELIDPLDALVCRVKVRPVEGAYHGYMSLPEDLAEGAYQLRFYTRFMEGQGDDYFFKRKIMVGDPLSALYYTQATFTYDDKKRIKTELQFIDAETQTPIIPEEIQILDEKQRLKTYDPDENGLIRLTLEPPKKGKMSVLYVKYDYKGKFHKEYIPIEISNDDFDVSFFPEGGQLPSGVHNKVAFKAVNSSGMGENISGVIVSEQGDTVDTFVSQHLGMGSFSLFTVTGKKNFALCKNDKGVERKFALPAALDSVVALKVNNLNDRINISVSQSAGFTFPEPLYLVIHCRGVVLNVSLWDDTKEFISINKADFPSSIFQILLTDSQLNPVSERLIFVINENDLAQLSFTTDKTDYKKRDSIFAQINISNSDRQALTGNFSLSVTSDRDVLPDTTVNVLSTLLLTSELKGYIESPAYYFIERNNTKMYHLDMLLLTQGWRRYDVSSVLQGKIKTPESYLELGPTISGMVKGGLLMTNPAADYPVKILAMEQGVFGQTTTDNKGRFVFNIPEFRDSIRFVVQATTPKNGSRVELLLDTAIYPKSHFTLPQTQMGNRKLFEKYLGKADDKFIQENGMHTIYLDEVVVTAKRNIMKAGKSSYSSPFNTIITAEELEKRRPRSLLSLLATIGGVVVSGDRVSIRNNGEPLILVDDVQVENDYLSMFEIDDLDEIEVVKDGAQTVIFGSRGANGVIILTTKRGFNQALRKAEQFNIKSIMPFGYQSPKEFYSPVYATPEELSNNVPDLRTTIYWNPNVQIVDGKASAHFYAADDATTYSVIIEGVTDDGKLIYAKETIARTK